METAVTTAAEAEVVDEAAALMAAMAEVLP